jgi:AcrR family transcriptional regulator
MVSISGRTRLTPEDRRAQLLALGVATLADHSIEQLGFERLAAEAGVSRALLFHYFGSKQGLRTEVVRLARDSMLRASQPDLTLPPLERLEDTLARLVGFVHEHGGTFYSLVRGAASADREVREAVDEAREVHTDRVVTVFRELGMADTDTLRIALRSWVAFAEQTLVDAVHAERLSDDRVVALLTRTAKAVVAALDEVRA